MQAQLVIVVGRRKSGYSWLRPKVDLLSFCVLADRMCVVPGEEVLCKGQEEHVLQLCKDLESDGHVEFETFEERGTLAVGCWQ